MKNIHAVARREIRAYFNSPIAYIVVLLFIVASMFLFYHLESFFGRNQAVLRGFFKHVPMVFLILIPGLTMRLWSEEKKLGTLELLMTLPVRQSQYVAGKFFGAWFLVGAALLFTLPIPITASMLGSLDLGPVIGGYLAAFLLGGTFVAIGTFMSALTENQIVALLGAILVGVLLYLPGTELVTKVLPESMIELARSVGLGARFESIERGVIDFRDLLYYVSLIFVFLVGNVLILKGRRWA